MIPFRSMKMYKITTTGEITPTEISKRLLASKFDMHSRDLRPVFLLRQLYTVSVRGNGVIVNLGEIKMCIGHEEAFFFSMTSERRERLFSEKLTKKLQNKQLEDHYIPFEFLILEVGFEYILQNILSHFQSFESRLSKLLTKISDLPSQKNFEKLLSFKNELLHLEKSVQELQNAINEVLDDEEEISSLLLDGPNKDHFEEDDAESILENILEQIMELAHKINQEKENIDNTQEIVTLKMATIRNTIIQLDLLASFGTSILAFGTLITGFYGMNLANGMESSRFAFWSIVGSVLILSLLITFLFFRFLKKKQIWS